MSFHDDMDRYLRSRKRQQAAVFINDAGRGSWWDRLWQPRTPPEDTLTLDEQAKLVTMEHEIKQGEHEIEHAATPQVEEQLETIQEERVSLYQQLRKLFQREHKVEDAYAEMAHEPMVDTSVTDDFRTLAQVQVKWFSRLPTRVKDEFKESEDFAKYREILQRRGVAKK